VAAIGPSADSKASKYTRLIPDANLAQFYPGFKNAYKVLNQFSEIYPAFRREEKEYFWFFQKIVNRNQLHLQPVFADLFFAYIKSFNCLLLVQLRF
jgi:hypothetical protein